MTRKHVDLPATFTIARQKWGGNGSGSMPANVAGLVAALPGLLRAYGVRSVIDLGCGDADWIAPIVRELGVTYVGVDVAPGPIASNKAKHPDLTFIAIKGPADPLPPADLVICRDVLAHLPCHIVSEVLEQARRAAPLLLATSFTKNSMNLDCAAGAYRPLNLQERPFHLPHPLESIPDAQHKSMCLWQMRDPDPVLAVNPEPVVVRFPPSSPPGGTPDVPNLDEMDLAGGMGLGTSEPAAAGLAGYRITSTGDTAPKAPSEPATTSNAKPGSP